MSMLTVNRCSQRSHLVEELVENWQLHHAESLRVGEVAELAQECVWLWELIEDAWDQIRSKLFDPSYRTKFDELDRAYQVLRLALARALGVFDVLARLIPPQHSPDFFATRERVRETAAQMDAQWPRSDEAMREAARRDFLEGNYSSSEELLNEAKGCHP